ncbi:MAG: ABC transporter permease [bacterium]|nr:ABC transporter permease [bacterium]
MWMLVWRNVWRRKGRSLITVAAVALSSAILIFFVSLQESTYSLAIDALSRFLTGHLQVQQRDYLDDPKLEDSFLADVSNITRHAVGIRGAVLERLAAGVLLSSGERAFVASIVGVEAEQERPVSYFPRKVTKGSFLEGSDSRQIVLGEGLARNLAADIGGEVTVLGQSSEGSLFIEPLTLSGILKTGNKELDRSIAFVDLETFADIFAMPDKVHSLTVVLKDSRQLPAVRADIEREVLSQHPGLAVRSWQEISPEFAESIALDRASGGIFFISLQAIVLLGLINVLSMSLAERRREHSMLVAIGVRRGFLYRLMLLESLLLSGIGLIAGIALGTLVTEYFGWRGFFIPGMEEAMSEWLIETAVYPHIGVYSLFAGAGIFYGSAFIASFIVYLPVFRISPELALRTSEIGGGR